MTLDLNTLNGPQRKIVRDALLSAYDYDDLHQLLEDELDIELNRIVREAKLEAMVFELIRVSNRQGWTDRLIDSAIRASGNPRLARLPDLLAASDALNLRSVEGAVARSDRGASEGGLERMVRRQGFADWGLWVERMSEIGHRICSIQYPRGVQLGGGTGFLVADDLVMTNFHVIEDHHAGSLDPAGIKCLFDFAAGSASSTSVPLQAADWLVDFSHYSPFDPGDAGGVPDADHLDYALLRLERAVGGDDVAAGKRGSMQLRTDCAVPAPDDILLIGQHPALQTLKLAVGEMLAANANDTRIRYDANTHDGSSGSPCLDMRLEVVALHHGGDPGYKKLLSKYNQGIPIAMIIKRIASRAANTGVTSFWT